MHGFDFGFSWRQKNCLHGLYHVLVLEDLPQELDGEERQIGEVIHLQLNPHGGGFRRVLLRFR